MTYTFMMYFVDYSENSLNQVIEQAIGKPFFDEHGKPIGEIVSATRVEDSQYIKFKIELEAV